MKRLFALIACTVVLANVHAAAQAADAGTTAFDILNMNFGAREIALAGGSIALPNELDGSQSNPAALAFSERILTSVGVRNLVMDVWGAMAVVGAPVKPSGVWAVSLNTISYGTVKQTLDENGPVETDNIYRSNAVSGGLSWAKTVWTTLAVGATIKGAYQYIGTEADHYSATGLAFDLGTQYRLLNSRLNLGFVVRNFGWMLKGYSDAYDSLPMPLCVGGGISYVPLYVQSVRINLDVEKTRGDYLNFRPGLEIAVYKRALFVRGGYAFSSRDAEEAVKVLSGDQNPDYQKSNWNTACLGIGLCTEPSGVKLDADAAVEFHVDAMPSVAVTVHVGY
jgi:hypothetical protein